MRFVHPSLTATNRIARSLRNMSHPNGSNGSNRHKHSPHTLESLQKWSCGAEKRLPPRDSIKNLHVYDFDNTLFCSPLPNPQLWEPKTLGRIMDPDAFVNGGWWHDSSFLAATGLGADKEEARAWEGWWNEHVVDLVRLSIDANDTLTVLLTGRGERNFAPLINRIVGSKKLFFDIVALKTAASPINSLPFTSTMKFKQAFLTHLVSTYCSASSIRIYEDRPNHARGFRDFFSAFNATLRSSPAPPTRPPLTAHVIDVTRQTEPLDATTEVAAIQRTINLHNMAFRRGDVRPNTRYCASYQIARTTLFTGYLADAPSTKKLLTLLAGSPFKLRESHEVRFMANAIVIHPGPDIAAGMLTRVGGTGHKVQWRVTDTGCTDNIWAAKISPVIANEMVHTDTRPASIVLASKRNAVPRDVEYIKNWTPLPPDQLVVFDSIVGDKVSLRIVEEHPAVRSRKGRRRSPRGGGGSSSYTNGGARAYGDGDGDGAALDADADGRRAKRVHVRESGFVPLGGGADGAIEERRFGYGIGSDENRYPPRNQLGPAAISANRGPGGNQNRAGAGGRGGRLNDRGGGGGGGGGGRGGGNKPHAARGGRRNPYRSLDDVGGGYQSHDASYGGGARGSGGNEGLKYDY